MLNCKEQIELVYGEEMNKKISLACTNCSNRNYSTYKNQLTSPERLTVMKYCKHCKKHVLHKETI